MARPACEELKLLIVFMPSLMWRFQNAEKQSGSPLTADNAQQIRNDAVSLMVSEETASKLEQRRGFRDLDPNNCWAEWQQLQSLGVKSPL